MNPALNNLLISRNQAMVTLQFDKRGLGRVVLRNVRPSRRSLWNANGSVTLWVLFYVPWQLGKNSMRVWSPRRKKQARVTQERFCRLEPEDVVELLHDHQGKYAFRVRGTEASNTPVEPFRSRIVSILVCPPHSSRKRPQQGVLCSVIHRW